jgi:hypothetical protein
MKLPRYQLSKRLGKEQVPERILTGSTATPSRVALQARTSHTGHSPSRVTNLQPKKEAPCGAVQEAPCHLLMPSAGKNRGGESLRYADKTAVKEYGSCGIPGQPRNSQMGSPSPLPRVLPVKGLFHMWSG